MPKIGGIYPFVLSKGAQRGWTCLFIIGVVAAKFLECEGFFPEFPQIPRKVFVQLLPTNFLPERSRPLFGVTSKKVFMCFWTSWAPFLPGFSGILRRFSANQNFWGWACNTTSNTTAFHNSFIGNCVVYQDQLETNLLQLFVRAENLEWFSIISVIIFEINTVDEHKQM